MGLEWQDWHIMALFKWHSSDVPAVHSYAGLGKQNAHRMLTLPSAVGPCIKVSSKPPYFLLKNTLFKSVLIRRETTLRPEEEL